MDKLDKLVNGLDFKSVLIKIKKILDDEITESDIDKWYDSVIVFDPNKYGYIEKNYLPYQSKSITKITNYDIINVIEEENNG